jgi:hypothetical protein
MSHIDDTRARLTKLRAHFGDKLLPRGTSVEETILKLAPDAERGANICDKGRERHELEGDVLILLDQAVFAPTNSYSFSEN